MKYRSDCRYFFFGSIQPKKKKKKKTWAIKWSNYLSGSTRTSRENRIFKSANILIIRAGNKRQPKQAIKKRPRDFRKRHSGDIHRARPITLLPPPQKIIPSTPLSCANKNLQFLSKPAWHKNRLRHAISEPRSHKYESRRGVRAR